MNGIILNIYCCNSYRFLRLTPTPYMQAMRCLFLDDAIGVYGEWYDPEYLWLYIPQVSGSHPYTLCAGNALSLLPEAFADLRALHDLSLANEALTSSVRVRLSARRRLDGRSICTRNSSF